MEWVRRKSHSPVISRDDVPKGRGRYRRSVTALAARGERFEEDERPLLPDVVLAVALVVAASLDLRFNLDNSTRYGSEFATAVVVATATLGLAWRRRWPFATLCLVAGAIAVPQLFGPLTFTLWGHFVPLLVAAYTAARWCSPRRATVAAVITGATVAIVLLRVPATGSAGNIPFAAVPAVGLMIAGRVLQRRHTRLRDLAERAHRLETHHEAELAAAMAVEQARIARELHDVVAHCVTVMVVQAGVAEALLESSPERAREPLQEVQSIGQQAIAELTRMLGLLRGAADASAGLAPQPVVAQLPDLVDRLTASGLDVQLASVGEVRLLPPGVDLTVFRIVQEALTNILKHAGAGAKAFVELRYLPRTVEVEITDTGTGTATATSGGHGLIGMAERVSVFGGELQTGLRPEGGFRVLAQLPLEHA
jgi:signal transduction histidine kinase